MEKLEHFAGLLVDLEIANEVLPILLDNGFDDWEQTYAILEQPDLLEKIGITDKDVQKKILASLSVAEEYQETQEEQKERQKEEENLQKQIMKEQQLQQENIMKEKQILIAGQKYQQLYETTPKKPITINDLLQATAKKQSQSMQQATGNYRKKLEDEYFQELNVLSLNDKKFTDFDIIEKCQNVKTLHLFGNCIFQISQSLLNLQKLTIIHLENNYIGQIENLDNCQYLQKLFLNNNYISRLEGLHNCPYLEELQISNQKSGKEFTFCEKTCQTLGQNLTILQIENSNICHIPEHFSNLQNLQILKLRYNKLKNYEEFIEPFKNIPYLQDLYLKDNPLTKVPKYRDKFVLIAKNLENLDDKKILPKERQFLFQLWKKKNGMLDNQQKPAQKKIPGLSEVSGQQVKIVDKSDQEYRDPKQYQKLNSNQDFNGYTAQRSTKHIPNKYYYG